MRLPIRRRKQQGTQATRGTSPPPAPLRPTIEPPPVEARQRAFVRGLATRARIQVARTGVAHAPADEAPSGRVDRLVAPVAPRRESRLERLRERTLELLRPGRPRPEAEAPPATPVPVLPVVSVQPEAPRLPAREVPASPEPRKPAGPSLDRPRMQAAPPPVREAKPPPPSRAPWPRPADPAASPAPPAVRAPVEQRFGVDLSRVQVHRGPESAAAARRLRARAFTVLGHVHVPSEAGPLTTGPGKALLAHELVHAAQQQRGPAVPAEASSRGRALEEEAQRFERAAAIPTADAATAHPAQAPVVAAEPAAAAPALVSLLADGANVPAGVQRAAEAGAAAQAPAAPEPSLDELVNTLYDQFSRRLRAELLVDRERAGALADR